MEQPDNDNVNSQQGQQYNYSGFNNSGGSLPTPNSAAVLVLGILTLVLCWCYGVVSVVLGTIALVLASSGEREYKLNPQAFSQASYKNLKAGKTCAIIGLCLAGITILCAVLYIILIGTLAFNFLNLGWGH